MIATTAFFYEKTTMPEVSVIIPTFNTQAHIEETLASILCQNDCDFEVIVIDDASTDDTVALIRQIDDPRVRLYVNEVNHGLPASMNLAMSLVQGKYIARIDHDDCALPDRLVTQARFLDENPHITAVGSQIQHFGLDDLVSDLPLDDGIIKARFVSGVCYFANPSAMWRTDFVRQNRIAYDPNLYVIDDLGFWFDCMLCGAKFANLPQVLLRYRIHARMTSMNLDAQRIYQSRRRLYKRLLPTYFPRLDGAACDALLELYSFGMPDDGGMSRLRQLHHAAGLALSEVSSALGQDPQEVKAALVELMNRRRSELLQSSALSERELAELDRAFYDVQDENSRPTRSPIECEGAGTVANMRPGPASISIEECFAQAPALCVKHDSYFQAYEALLAQYVGQPITFVEVGVFNGGSLHMWRRYFGEQARIIGVDLNPDARKWQAEGFEIFIGDQSDANFWRHFYETVGAIDVLLDDGGHMNHQQLVTTEHALEHINDGGMLIVEDVHTSYMPGFNSKPEHSFVSFGKHIVDAVNGRFPGIDTGANLFQDRVWSVSFYESIVAFRIDRRRCFQSSWISNAGAAMTNQDYRHEGIACDSLPDIDKYFEPEH